MKSDPIRDYFKSMAAFKVGNKPEAERFLAASLGLKELTPILKSSLSKVLDPDNPNPVVAHLVAHRVLSDEGG